MSTPDRLGDFEIVDEIGRGGFGIVYRARQISLDRPVAVKVLFRHLIHTEDQVSRFEREARAAARLDHPNIVSVFAWGQSKDDFFIAQRLIGRGRTLADDLAELRESGEPPKGYFRQVADRLAKVADGLQQAHDRGIVHRDVKASNILLDEAGNPCLGDFGLAKVEDGLELSRTGDFAGSPFYMSPEQADSRRGPVDHRSDIYSLGVTLFEALTLEHPFQGKTSHEIMRAILSEEPRRPQKIEPRVPRDLETICLHAMEKNPEARYPSALEMANDLRSFLDGEPISAVPIGTTRRVLRAMRRNREPVVFSLFGAVVILGGLWAVDALMSSKTTVQQATTQEQLQTTRAEEIGDIGEKFGQAIQDAAAHGDSDEVAQLAAQQQEVTRVLNENYQWLAQQVEEIAELGDRDGLQQVGTGFATGGLQGALMELQNVVLSRQTASSGESNALELELSDRMNALSGLKDYFRENEPAVPPPGVDLGLDPVVPEESGADGPMSELDLSKVYFQFVNGKLYAVPIEWLGEPPDGAMPSRAGGGGSTGAVSPASSAAPADP
ncbi:MAG: serine/threonine-protein kinase [Planctomycetota bacterium]|jgi:hypothetical protein